MMGSSIPAVLRERASLQPNDPAFTFIDYEQDGTEVSETLTWSQLYRRSANIAAELSVCGSAGDRAVILAPQGLDYIAASVGSLQAGLIAVALSVPQAGTHDERVNSVLRDTSPSVILTTSSVVGSVTEYAQSTDSDPTVVVVDSVDQGSRKRPRDRAGSGQEIAYLQYTSGSTREPAGVVVTNRNLSANFEQMYADYFRYNVKVAEEPQQRTAGDGETTSIPCCRHSSLAPARRSTAVSRLRRRPTCRTVNSESTGAPQYLPSFGPYTGDRRRDEVRSNDQARHGNNVVQRHTGDGAVCGAVAR